MSYPNFENKGKAYWKNIHTDWKSLVNMTASELEKFADSYWGKQAGLSRDEAREKGISSGRDSARAIIRMKKKSFSKWTKQDWLWARKQVNFIKRFTTKKSETKRSPRHPLWEDGEPTRYLLALLIWGHNPLPKKLSHYGLA